MPKIYSSKHHSPLIYFFILGLLLLCVKNIAHAQADCIQITPDYTLVDNKGEHIISLWGLETLVPLDVKKAQTIIDNDFCDSFDLNLDIYTIDRYGDKKGLVSNQRGDIILQELLLKNGLAIIGTPNIKDDKSTIKQRFHHIQQTPEQSKMGVWQDDSQLIMPATNTKALLQNTGSFKIVTGRIIDISARRNITYINFDDDWKNDFTIMIPKTFKRDFESLNITRGDTVKVQGIIEKYYGPMMKVQNIQQITKAVK